MVQNISQAQNPYGSINRIGTTPDGRVVYKVMDGNGDIAGGLSVAQKDCDTFERTYNDIMTAAPKLEKYMQTHSEEDIKRLQKRGKRIIGGSALVCGIIPALFSHKLTSNKWLQVAMTLGGTFIGLFAGVKIGTKVMTPPGANEMSKATKTLSSLDVQPIEA